MKKQSYFGESTFVEVHDRKKNRLDIASSCPETQGQNSGAKFRKDEVFEPTSQDGKIVNSSTLITTPVPIVGCVHAEDFTVDVRKTSDCITNVLGQFTRFTDSFYNVSCEELAQNLLGKILVRTLENGIVLKGRIVETECYLGGEDKASHSYNGKVTPRNRPMYMKPGTTYVYFTYGMYFCFNISSQGDGAAVLVRAVDPLQGHEFMKTQRINKRMSSKKNVPLTNTTADINKTAMKPHELCNGPGKLCVSFCIDSKSCNMQDLCTWKGMWIESDSDSAGIGLGDLITSTRIGIDSAGFEWAQKLLRFYIFGNHSVSKRDRKREQEKVNLFKGVEA